MFGLGVWGLSAKTRILPWSTCRLLGRGLWTNRIWTMGFFCRVKNIHISRIRA